MHVLSYRYHWRTALRPGGFCALGRASGSWIPSFIHSNKGSICAQEWHSVDISKVCDELLDLLDAHQTFFLPWCQSMLLIKFHKIGELLLRYSGINNHYVYSTKYMSYAYHLQFIKVLNVEYILNVNSRMQKLEGFSAYLLSIKEVGSPLMLVLFLLASLGAHCILGQSALRADLPKENQTKWHNGIKLKIKSSQRFKAD